jgi:D-threo-aldose 1-dehydrogenase
MTRYSALTLGSSSWRATRDRDGSDAAPRAVLDRILSGTVGMSVVDTSNNYGEGFSELLIGDALRAVGGVPEGIVIATKLDRDPSTNAFSAERMTRSLEESLDRLGMASLPLLYLHDPESISVDYALSDDGPVRALERFRAAGLADRIGISGGPAPMLEAYVSTGLFDALITHNRYTLVDRSSDALLDLAAQHGTAVFNAAPYGSAPLARWPAPVTEYAYRPAHPDVSTAIGAMGEACAAHDIPLAAAALQFSLREPRISSTVVGINTIAQLEATLANVAIDIPSELWLELEDLTPAATSRQDPPGPNPWNDPHYTESSRND